MSCCRKHQDAGSTWRRDQGTLLVDSVRAGSWGSASHQPSWGTVQHSCTILHSSSHVSKKDVYNLFAKILCVVGIRRPLVRSSEKVQQSLWYARTRCSRHSYIYLSSASQFYWTVGSKGLTQTQKILWNLLLIVSSSNLKICLFNQIGMYCTIIQIYSIVEKYFSFGQVRVWEEVAISHTRK